jgi:hypothetical protein
MLKLFNLYLKNLLIFTVALAIICLAWQLILPGFISRHWWVLLIFFLVATGILLRMAPADINARFSRFVNYFMLTSMLKILILIIVLVLYALMLPHELVRFAITLLVLYFVYLGFEVYWLLRLQKKDK